MRFAQMKCLRVALLGQTVYDRTAGITQAHDLGTLVKCFTGSIVDGLPQHLHLVITIDPDNLRIASGYQQTDKGIGGLAVFFALHLYKVSHDVCLQMVDIYKGNIKCRGKPLGKGGTYQQRPHESRSAGKGQRVDRSLVDTRPAYRFGHDRYDVLLMRT